MNIEKTILSEEVNSWFFKEAKNDGYLVGGYVRDLLCGRASNDRDFIVRGNAQKFAKKAAKILKGTFVELKKNETYRVSLGNMKFLDFSRLKCQLEDDLVLRDFTINAIAWSPGSGLVDPSNGITDLKNNILRVIHPDNLLSDPLRILRAFRIAAQLGLDIDLSTLTHLKNNAPRLRDAAAERTAEEMIKLVLCGSSYLYLNLSSNYGVLSAVTNLTHQDLELNIALIQQIEEFIASLNNGRSQLLHKYRELRNLNQIIGQGLNRDGLLKLSILLYKSGSSEMSTCIHPKFSNAILNKMKSIHECMNLARGRITEKKLYEIFEASHGCEMEMALLLSVFRPRNVDKYFARADLFLQGKRNSFVDGHDVEKIMNCGPTALIGTLLREIERRRFLGLIRNKREALKWLRANLT